VAVDLAEVSVRGLGSAAREARGLHQLVCILDARLADRLSLVRDADDAARPKLTVLIFVRAAEVTDGTGEPSADALAGRWRKSARKLPVRIVRSCRDAQFSTCSLRGRSCGGSGLIDPEDEGCGEGNSGQEGVSASVVSGVDASRVLETCEHVFDFVALTVEHAIIVVLEAVAGVRRDAGCDACRDSRASYGYHPSRHPHEARQRSRLRRGAAIYLPTWASCWLQRPGMRRTIPAPPRRWDGRRRAGRDAIPRTSAPR